MIKRGLFISFEGIDGCGKSTQIWKIAKYIFDLSKYNHLVITREPYQDANIREILKSEDDPYSQARKLASLFVADRKNHLDSLIQPNLTNGIHVISDRYDCSTLAYQQAQGPSFEELVQMHKNFLKPDLTFIVDLPIEIAAERMKKDSNRVEEQKFEKNKPFIEKLRACYLDIPQKILHRDFVIVNGNSTPDEIFYKQIKPAFDNIYQRWSEK